MNNPNRWRRVSLVLLWLAALAWPLRTAQAAGTTYYVSSSGGSDGNNGLSAAAPFASVSKVNGLNLQPGDTVLFKCGDTWRATPLVLSKSGTAQSPITFGSYPDAACANQPLFSGARSISSWSSEGGSLYSAALNSTDFPNGINQLFRNGQRLTPGRWPNLDAGNGGYATVDAHSAGSAQISDAALPAADWSGAVLHIRNIRWSMLDRQVTASASHSLTLNSGFSCLASGWSGCAGWGYFLNNARAALDQDGEWYYDSAARRVYLVSTGGTPANIEGSVVLNTDSGTTQGGLMLSAGGATAFVTVDNLAFRGWFKHGVSAPSALGGDVFHDLTLRNLTIADVDGAGMYLATWLYNLPSDQVGFRGGYNLHIENNRISGANSFGVTGFFINSIFQNNTLTDIGMLANLGAAGMGCGYTASECTENGDGFRILTDRAAYTGYGNLLYGNHFERTAYNAVDIFGHENTLQANFITQACAVKADCGAVRTFGRDSLSATAVYDLQLLDNLIVDIPGNVDGCAAGLPAFGMGFYIDNYSRNVTLSGNTIANTTATGILYQQSTGAASRNTIFNAGSAPDAYSAQFSLSGDSASVQLNANTFFALEETAWTLYTANRSLVAASDNNRFYHPYQSATITYDGYWPPHTLAEWRAASGKDAHSSTLWYSQPAGEPSRAAFWYNSTAEPLEIDLGDTQYLDLDQNPVSGALWLAPREGRILVENGPAALSLSGLSPAMSAADSAADFTLTVFGAAFTEQSVVNWNGSPRATVWVKSSQLQAQISAADVSALGSFPVSVSDPALGETEPVYFLVVERIYPLYLPAVRR
jgi:hypothetical protein